MRLSSGLGRLLSKQRDRKIIALGPPRGGRASARWARTILPNRNLWETDKCSHGIGPSIMQTSSQLQPNDPRWKRYEKLVARMYATLSSHPVQVQYDVKLPGKLSRTPRQIDVCLRTSIPGSDLVVIVQCRDHRSPLDANHVGEFCTVIEDVGAQKGVMVTQAGFTKAAVTLANSKGVDLLTLIDAENKLWSEYFPEDGNRYKQVVSVPIMVRRSRLSMRLQIPVGPDFNIEGDAWKLEMLDAETGESLGTLTDIVGQLWGEGTFIDETPDASYLLTLDRAVRFNEDRSQSKLRQFVFMSRIQVTYHLGRMPIEKLEGFYNPVQSSVTTKAIATGEANFSGLITEGTLVTKEEAERANVTMGFDIADAWDVRQGFTLPPHNIRQIPTPAEDWNS
jgi:Restriction endonuclease